MGTNPFGVAAFGRLTARAGSGEGRSGRLCRPLLRVRPAPLRDGSLRREPEDERHESRGRVAVKAAPTGARVARAEGPAFTAVRRRLAPGVDASAVSGDRRCPTKAVASLGPRPARVLVQLDSGAGVRQCDCCAIGSSRIAAEPAAGASAGFRKHFLGVDASELSVWPTEPPRARTGRQPRRLWPRSAR